jgi:IclR family transcriptional regulator, acetate operon repressor
MPVSTTYRYVSSLRSLGFLSDNEGTYGAGPRLLRLVRQTDVDQSLARLADPILGELVDRTGETAILTVRVGTLAFCLHTVEPIRAVRLSFARGSTQPLFAGASAKPLLAHAGDRFIDDLIDSGAVTFSEQTPDAETLRRQLAQIRATGVCVTSSEVDADALAVGVPVSWGGSVAAALSVAGPIARFDKRKFATTVDLVIAGGAALERVLDGVATPGSAVAVMDSLRDDGAVARPGGFFSVPGTRRPLPRTAMMVERTRRGA